VTYKTAWRMLKQIRTLLDEDTGPLSGEVEVDETFIGGKLRNSDRRKARAAGVKPNDPTIKQRQIVVAAVERNGRVRASVVPDRTAATLHGKIREFVLPESMIFTDEWALYRGIGREYRGHRRINHSQRIYVDMDGATTNSAESFFALFKNSVRGAHHNVSAKYLPHYLNEYTFRWNRRKASGSIFWSILDQVAKAPLHVA
jgi:transposase